MQQIPVTTHGFNHQSFYRQPVSNLRQIQDIVSYRTNDAYQYPDNNSNVFVSKPTSRQESHLQLEDRYASIKPSNKTRIQVALNTNQNQNRLSGVSNDGALSSRQARPTNVVLNPNQTRLIRQASLDSKHVNNNGSSRKATPLTTSRSTGIISDSIQRERKAHTLAPANRILGPISSIKTSAFANVTVPNDSQAKASSGTTQTFQTQTHRLESDKGIETSKINNKTHRHHHRLHDNGLQDDDNDESQEEDEVEETETQEENEEFDNAPIIVKVRFDPNQGGPPSADAIRHALGNQLQQQSTQMSNQDSIILNFVNRRMDNSHNQQPVRPQPLYINKPVVTISPSTYRLPTATSTLTQQNLQRLQQQRQYQQYQQQQQQQQMQQRRKQYEAEQLYLQQQRERQLQQQPQQQHPSLQQKAEQLQRFREGSLQQQGKQNQQFQQYLQEHTQNPYQQLMINGQQLQQQRYRQLIEQQQQNGNYQELLQHANQQKRRNPSLPPIAPRTLRNVPPVRPIPVNQLLIQHQQTNNVRNMQSSAHYPTRVNNRNPISTIHIQPLQNSHVHSTNLTNSLPTGLNANQNQFRKYMPNPLVSTNSTIIAQQQQNMRNATRIPHVPPQPIQRPNTAPGFTERFRPPSVLDIPELNHDNLSDMLRKIPGLQGSRFHIQYIEPAEPHSYPIPSSKSLADQNYPEPTFVDELPNDIMRHVRSSDNIALKAALDPPAQPKEHPPSVTQALNKQSSVMKHPNSQAHQRVQRHRTSISTTISDTTTQKVYLK